MFDLDGTVIDPKVGITKSVQYALEKFGITEDRDNLTKFIGPPMQDSFQQYCGFAEEKALQAVAYYREYFGTHGKYENEVYEGMVDLLARLQKSGKRSIIATSKATHFSEEIIEYLGLKSYFEMVIGATLDGSRRAKADIIALVLEQLGDVDRDSIIMIGDREHDIIGAQAHRLDSIEVLYGYGSQEEIEGVGPTHVAESVQALGTILGV
jgi:phosphoglycolate phosphatase